MKIGKPSKRSLDLSKFNSFKDSSKNKKMILNAISSKSRETFSNIISRISNACYNMVNRFNGDEATMSNMRNIAMGQTRRLSMEFRKINYKNEQMNLHYLETYSDNPDLISPIRNQEKSPISISDVSLSYSEISQVEFDNEKTKKQANKINKYFKKKEKLDKLKGEMLLMDQRKKYHINKTYEKPRVFNKGHFLRKEDDSSYKPRYKYNKDNLFYLKTYHSPQSSTENNFFPTHSRVCSAYLSTNTASNTRISLSYKSNRNRNNKVNGNSALSTSGSKYSSGKYCLSETYSKSKKKKSRDNMIVKIRKVQLDTYKKSKRIKSGIERDKKEYEDSKKIKKPIKIKYNFDLKKIKEEFHLGNKTNSKIGKDNLYIDETKLLFSNAERVSKNLDHKSRIILSQLVTEMIHEQERLNNNFDQGSIYDRQLTKIKQKKEFKQVSDQTMALKKLLNENKTIEPKNEKEKIYNIMKNINDDNLDNINNLKEVLLKSRVMENIKPLLYNNRCLKKKEKKIKLKQ